MSMDEEVGAPPLGVHLGDAQPQDEWQLHAANLEVAEHSKSSERWDTTHQCSGQSSIAEKHLT